MNAALPLDDVLEEADRLLTAAAAAGVTLRLIGGVAVWFHTDHVHPVLARPYGDIDFATTKGGGRRVAELIAAQGYEPAKEFNALNGSRRLLFHDHAHDRKVDVFVATFEMCHTIPIADRLDLEERTIPLAELLLTKLQIVELTEKDVRDTLALLHEHDVADHDGDAINAAFVARLTANDWGLWRTVKLNVERLQGHARSVGLDAADQELVLGRLERLWEKIERTPKSRAWKLRDRIGDRKRWYELPDEA